MKRYGMAAGAAALLMVAGLTAYAQTPSDSTQTGKPAAGKQTSGASQESGSKASAVSGNPGEKTFGSAGNSAGVTGKDSARSLIRLKKDLPGDFLYQFESAKNEITAPTQLPAATDGIVGLPLPNGWKLETTTLVVIDSGRGNVARLPLTSGALSLNESSFLFVQQVRVPVQAKGAPVTDVAVSLETADKKFHQNLILTPTDHGIAVFRNVPTGVPVTLSVQYASHPNESQTKTLTHDHPADGYTWPIVQLDWADAKTTTPLAAASSAGPHSDVPTAAAPVAPIKSEQNNALNSIINLVIGLLVVGGGVFGIYWAFMNNKFTPFLDKLGVPAQPAVDPNAANPFTAKERTPIQPITEGTADPILGGTAAAAGMPPGFSEGPRLIATMGAISGNIYPLNGSSVEIGRDPGCTVSLVGDGNASRHHASLMAGPGGVQIIDQNSSNGTFVNGVRIPSGAPHPLNSGDEIQIGQSRFRLEA